MSNDGTRDEAKNLPLESLDKMVGGTGALLPIAKRPGADPDVLTGAFAGKIGDFNKPTGGGFISPDDIPPPPIEEFNQRIQRNNIEKPIEQAMKGWLHPEKAAEAFDTYLKGPKGKALTPADWTVVYDCFYGSGFKTVDLWPSADIQEALKAKFRPHIEEIVRGMTQELGKFSGSPSAGLKHGIGQASDVAAHLISKADSPQVREDILAKAKSGFESGLDIVKGTREGKSIADLINNPQSEDAWKTAMAEVAVSAAIPTKVSVVKFLTDQMATTAVLKHIGLGQYDPLLQQSARAMVNAMNTATDAAVDLYKNGFVAALTMGLDVKGLINIGKNVGDFGKAVGSGDVAAMGKAAKALVVDALNDVKDGLEKFYVGGTIKVANWTKDLTMSLLNDLGATPYAEIAVQETKKAFIDFGNKAKAGSEAAISVLAEFATKDVARAGQQAVDALADVGKSGVREAEKAINVLGDLAKSGARQAESAVNALGDVGKSGVREAEKAVNVLGDVAKSGVREAEKAVNALGDVARSGGRKAEAAVNTLSDVAKSGVREAEKAVNTLGDVAKSGVKEADKAINALGDLAKSGVREAGRAINVLADVGKSGVREAEKAINTLADIGKAGGAYANVAIDELKNLSRHVESAANALASVANSGVKYAEGAWKSVKGALEDTWNKIWPF